MRGVKNDLTGRTFGLLSVSAPAYSHGKRTYWRCRCDCGRECIKDGHELLRTGKRTRLHSCGCQPELVRSISKQLGGPGHIAGHSDRRHHRGQGRRT